MRFYGQNDSDCCSLNGLRESQRQIELFSCGETVLNTLEMSTEKQKSRRSCALTQIGYALSESHWRAATSDAITRRSFHNRIGCFAKHVTKQEQVESYNSFNLNCSELRMESSRDVELSSLLRAVSGKCQPS